MDVGSMGVGRLKAGEPSQEGAAASAQSGPGRSRRLYQKPAFKFERVFETMALSCGKLSPTQFQCRIMKNS
jgi:hypothetical protein